MKLIDFLIDAKKRGYATGGELEEIQLERGFKGFEYSNSEYKYRDTYYGMNPFSGYEFIWKGENAIWSMNYYGFAKPKEVDIISIYSFLREAMLKIDEDYPFRGPKEHNSGEYFYQNQQFGSIEHFWGVEKIFIKGAEVYQLNYHGGNLRQS